VLQLQLMEVQSVAIVLIVVSNQVLKSTYTNIKVVEVERS